VLFTVYHTLEPHSLELIRMLPSLKEESEYDDDLPSDTSDSKLQHFADGKHCLMNLSVRNSYGVPFEVSLSRPNTSEEGEPVTVTRLVPPGATERCAARLIVKNASLTNRLILPVPRLTLPLDEVSKSVPSLLDRQYVVDKSKKTVDQARMDKELFWYRHSLLSSIQATWVEVSMSRNYGMGSG
jgi:hypothetical protein